MCVQQQVCFMSVQIIYVRLFVQEAFTVRSHLCYFKDLPLVTEILECPPLRGTVLKGHIRIYSRNIHHVGYTIFILFVYILVNICIYLLYIISIETTDYISQFTVIHGFKCGYESFTRIIIFTVHYHSIQVSSVCVEINQSSLEHWHPFLF